MSANNISENILKTRWGTQRLNSINEDILKMCEPKVTANRTYFRQAGGWHGRLLITEDILKPRWGPGRGKKDILKADSGRGRLSVT